MQAHFIGYTLEYTLDTILIYSPYPAIELESSCKSLKHTHNAKDVLVRYFLPLRFYTP